MNTDKFPPLGSAIGERNSYNNSRRRISGTKLLSYFPTQDGNAVKCNIVHS
jgi:hypothetical protein